MRNVCVKAQLDKKVKNLSQQNVKKKYYKFDKAGKLAEESFLIRCIVSV